MKETQRTISDWADKTFGYSKGVTPAINRMLKEVEELVALKDEESFELADADKIANECADIYITMCRVFDVIGFDLQSCVDHKMQINRARKWELKGDGTGRHVKE